MSRLKELCKGYKDRYLIMKVKPGPGHPQYGLLQTASSLAECQGYLGYFKREGLGPVVAYPNFAEGDPREDFSVGLLAEFVRESLGVMRDVGDVQVAG